MIEISTTLHNWYLTHRRALPWRETKDPYFIWISEIILQQTRVDQGLDYYNRFIKAFPTVEKLANAPEQEVLRLWQGLGYYARARNLHSAAKQVMNEYKGVIPSTFKELLSLKGVGPYTATAIGSFAFGKPLATVDGNVYRVLSRLFEIKTNIHSTTGKKEFQYLADKFLGSNNPRTHNNALMEFGAIQCTVQPDCNVCALQSLCGAYLSKSVSEFPNTAKEKKIKQRYFYFMVHQNSKGFLLEQRTKKDIWQGLYQFPLIENNTPIELDELSKRADTTCQKVLFEVTHLLTHQKLHISFVAVNSYPRSENTFHAPTDTLHKLPFPKPMVTFLQKQQYT